MVGVGVLDGGGGGFDADAALEQARAGAVSEHFFTSVDSVVDVVDAFIRSAPLILGISTATKSTKKDQTCFFY